jgi:hypothetical protein
MNYTQKYLLDKIKNIRELADIWMSSESHLLRTVAKDLLKVLDGK